MKSTTMEKIYHFCELIFNFFILTFCWGLGTLLGAVVFGWAPSTVSLLSVSRDKITGNEKGNTAAVFWKVYKREFKKANKIGIIFSFFAYITLINRANFYAQYGTLFSLLALFSQIAQWILLGLALYLFPMYVHYEADLKTYFSRSFSFLLFRPLYTASLAIWCWALFSFAVTLPAIALFFGISLFAYGVMAINYQLYRRNEDFLNAGE